MSRERPGPALIGLVAILAITAGWWALALWPVGVVEPEWLARTRAACFGSAHGGLPDAGGWILLIGEPVGMLAMLWAGWRRSLARDLRVVFASPRCRVAVSSLGVLFTACMLTLGARVAHAYGVDRFETRTSGVVVQRLDRTPPPFELADQQGRRTSLADLRGRPVLLTFAYGHCSTVCPATVSGLRNARRRAQREDVPIVIITVDPWRDTADRLAMIASMWGLSAGDRVLSGDAPAVERVLDSLGVFRQRDEQTGDVAHAAVVYIIDAAGRLAWRVDGGTAEVDRLLRGL